MEGFNIPEDINEIFFPEAQNCIKLIERAVYDLHGQVVPGLAYYDISLYLEGKHLRDLDHHFEESVAYACAKRWGKRLGLPLG